MFQWRDDKYGGNFSTRTDDPAEVRKALKEVRYNFKQAGNKPVESKVEPKPFNQEEWNKELLKEVEALKAKKATEAMPKEDRMAKLKESSERVKAKTASAFDKMAEESSKELDEVLDTWDGDTEDKAGFIKWIKSDAPYDKKKYKVTAAWRETITKLRKHIKD